MLCAVVLSYRIEFFTRWPITLSNRSRISAVTLILIIVGGIPVFAQTPATTGGFQPDRAMKYLTTVCAFGPRPSGSVGMRQQRDWLVSHFEKLGATVRRQEFRIRHPYSGEPVSLANLIITWHPDRSERVLFAAHYDTRPFPDEELSLRLRRGLFIGANDGASGVAFLCEFGNMMRNYRGKYGVDFIFFDGEEFVFGTPRDQYFLGSTHFARAYSSEARSILYRAGILVDMIGDADLQIYKEKASVRYAPDLVRDIWQIAEELKVTAFRSRVRHQVRDDHLPLNQIARIPTIDIIDFDYPKPGSRRSYWHTQADTPDKCSGESLALVGKVLWTWLTRIR